MNAIELNETECWQAVANRNAAEDGHFLYAVKTTGVYCRPSCASRLPKRENVEFFHTAEEAKAAGYRPCLRCQQPAQANWTERICRHIEEHLDEPLTLPVLSEIAGL